MIRKLGITRRSKALSVVSPPTSGKPARDRWPNVAGELVVDELHRLDDLDGVEGDARYGNPGEELATFSADVDLLVIGSRGYRPVAHVFNGSISNYLERHARCPLLVLPAGSGGRESGILEEQPAADRLASTDGALGL
jgi:nucleotide-binding universal stress UspA family protein